MSGYVIFALIWTAIIIFYFVVMIALDFYKGKGGKTKSSVETFDLGNIQNIDGVVVDEPQQTQQTDVFTESLVLQDTPEGVDMQARHTEDHTAYQPKIPATPPVIQMSKKGMSVGEFEAKVEEKKEDMATIVAHSTEEMEQRELDNAIMLSNEAASLKTKSGSETKAKWSSPHITNK